MKYFLVQNGEIAHGPVEVSAPSRNRPLRLKGLELHNKPQSELAKMGWLPEEITGFEPFNSKTQIRTGPVITILVDKVVSAYTIRGKTAQELGAEKEEAATNGINTPQNKVIRDALWELRQAIKGILVLPDETKAQYTARLKELWKVHQ